MHRRMCTNLRDHIHNRAKLRKSVIDVVGADAAAVVIGYPSRPRVCVVLEALLEPDRGDSCRADLTLIINRIAGGSGLVSLSRPLVEDFTVNWIRPGRRVPVDDAAFEPGHAALPVREPDLVVGGYPSKLPGVSAPTVFHLSRIGPFLMAELIAFWKAT